MKHKWIWILSSLDEPTYLLILSMKHIFGCSVGQVLKCRCDNVISCVVNCRGGDWWRHTAALQTPCQYSAELVTQDINQLTMFMRV